MSLITINGQNPFNGQKDPYLSMDSSIDYSSNDESIKHTYTLNGVLTGCTRAELDALKNNLVQSFDWKDNPSIPSQIIINGVVVAHEDYQLIPVSLDFENSNYIGGLQYTLKLEIFTGIESSNEADKNLINKTHTETTTISENGLTSISTNISCSPNQNLSNCGSIDAANKWVQEQLGATKLGSISQTKNLPLQNESLKINPISSEVSYSSVHSEEPDTSNGSAPEGDNEFKLALCEKTSETNEACGGKNSSSEIQGEVYKSGATQEELANYLDTQVFKGSDPMRGLTMQYSEKEDKISFSANKTPPENLEPENVTVNDYTITFDSDFQDPQNNTTTANGNFFILNPKGNASLNQSINGALQIGHSLAGGGKIISQTATQNDGEQTISYSVTCGEGPAFDNDKPTLEEVSGLAEYSISFTPAIDQHKITYMLGNDCEPKIQKLSYQSRASVSIDLTVVSGEDYNFLQVAKDKLGTIRDELVGDPEELRVTEDTEKKSLKGDSVNRRYAATFKGESVLKDGKIDRLM